MIDVPIQVKDALRDGRLRKNYRFVVLNEDGTENEIGTIDNNNLVSESVSIDERMCSGDTLKFGLCEGSSLEFQYFGKPNITGKRVQAFVDVDYGEAEPYTIPMGFFDVQKCSRQASTGIIKATCYNKLQSTYLDVKANELLLSELDDPSINLTIYGIRKTLLEQFEINPYENIEQESNVFRESSTIDFTVKLANLTSDTGPINYYQMQRWADEWGLTVDTNTVLGVEIVSTGRKWIIPAGNNNYYQFVQLVHDFSTLSENYVSYLIDFFDACPINKSGETIINGIKNISTGWQYAFGIIYKKGQTTKYYNDYGYKYQNDGTYRVDGTSRDFFKQLLTDDAECTIEYRAVNQINISIIKKGNSYELGEFKLVGADALRYLGSNFEAKYYPCFKYEDGTYIPASSAYIERLSFDDWFKFCQIKGMSNADTIIVNPITMPDFTLRDITAANYETICQFGQLSRLTDLFSGVELNRSALYPADTLYPDNDLYPNGAQESLFKSQYSKLWADEGNIHKWRNLIITYKGLDEQGNEKEYTLQRQVNADGTDDYNCSDNWLFRNLIWTSEQIAEYAVAMVAKMQNMTWFPFEMWCAGLPYLETGDEIEMSIGNETYTSYILQRTLKGIQDLQDTYINGTLDIF